MKMPPILYQTLRIILASHLIVIGLAFYYQLSMIQLLALYWWEGIWIGIFAALELIVASVLGHPFDNRHMRTGRFGSVVITFFSLSYLSSIFLGLIFWSGAAIYWLTEEMTGRSFWDVMNLDDPGLRSAAATLITLRAVLFAIALIQGRFRYIRASSLLKWPLLRFFGFLICIFLGVIVWLANPDAVNQEIGTANIFALTVLGFKLMADLLTTWVEEVVLRRSNRHEDKEELVMNSQ